jgi:predicted RNA-binding protein Jag
LYNSEGLKAMTDVEEKRLKQQEVEAKIITQENKLLTPKMKLNAKVELNRITAEYNEKVAKRKATIHRIEQPI